MSKIFDVQCDARLKRGESGRCLNKAVIGTYAWRAGETTVNPDKPVAVFCGPHKPRLRLNQMLRNIRLRTT